MNDESTSSGWVASLENASTKEKGADESDDDDDELSGRSRLSRVLRLLRSRPTEGSIEYKFLHKILLTRC